MNRFYIACAPALLASACATLPHGYDSLVGRRAPNVALTTADGKRLDLSAFSGKPVVLNFWATWCGPCKAEMPLIDRYQRSNKQSGLETLAINVHEDADAVQKFARDNGYSFTFVVDKQGRALDAYRVSSIPMTVFIDASGVVKSIHQGPIDEALMQQRLAEIMPSVRSEPIAVR